eukprot:TRINITY_DN3796_c0_g2_i1.p1 TRINITY_DN3796_c0_g2~~TRINITY_DN3796_c0_g2_i1.p1  ORF type:complete len:473 (-),score=218.61 TRINITY_DN3796_c0_g2_i1:71-1489(-)
MQQNQLINSSLTALSPLDGRYKKQVEKLSNYFSEFALIKYRVRIEVEYLFALNQLGLIQQFTTLNSNSNSNSNSKILNEENLTQVKIETIDNFSIENAEWIKKKEEETKHDVKAVEYFLKEILDKHGCSSAIELVHFALTSQDINNTAIPLALREAIEQFYIPLFETKLLNKLFELGRLWLEQPLLARTHGQPATPSRVGKELFVFIERLKKQLHSLKTFEYEAKFGGAIGLLNAHYVAFPNIDWITFANQFISKLGLNRQQFTTQIEHYDSIASLFHILSRINTILLDLSKDIWTYISLDYFHLKTEKNEVGSSTMPHKVNPIDFENAEGNLGIANALFEHMASKLPISRLQRDLSDSTVLRNIGVAIGHTIIAFESISRGLNKLELNVKAINEDLERNWIIVAEAYQTILRRIGYPQPYEALKHLTRGQQNITKELLHQFVDQLNISDEVKIELKQISPFNYIGKVPKLP